MAETVAILGALASVASAGLRLLEGQAQARALSGQAALMRVQARQGELSARGEELRGTAEAQSVRETLLRTLAAQQARYSAAGLALGEGTPLTLEEEAQAEAERQLEVIRTQTVLNAEGRRIGAASAETRALLLSDQAAFARLAGPLSAGATLAEGGVRAWERWPGRTVQPRTAT
jgi:hypothetical protein